MDRFFKWKAVLILLVVGFSIWAAYPPKEKINLGLDLQGGMQMLLEVKLNEIPQEAQEDATDRAVEVIRGRIDEFGVREPSINKEGANFIAVQLPGITDYQRARDIVGRTAHLEFKLVSDDLDLMKKAEEGTPVEGYELKEIKSEAGESRKVLVETKSELTGDHLTTASVGFDQYGQAIVQLQFDDNGAKIFDQLTFKNIGKQLAIVLDGSVHSAPVIRDRIPNGQAQISGNFTPEEASDLALVLRAGALPAPVEVINLMTVGPSLGRDSITKGIKAGLMGAIMVFIFMPIYYLLPGVIANIGLLIYIVILLGSLALLQASLTLPGIAGFILSIGMAVDANVLIFERIREERETGKTPRAAISAGYHKAFGAIFDSNLTTLITSLILFIFGTGPVKGFAVTLSVGIIASMFSAILVTRVLFDILTKWNPKLDFRMMKFIGVTKINFLKGRFLAYGFSVICLGIGILSFTWKGHSNYGVEFQGGSLIQIQALNSMQTSDLRDALEKNGIKNPIIQRYGSEEENQFVIKAAEKDPQKIEQAIGTPDQFKVVRVEQIGPAVSKDLRKKALMAVFFSCIAILLYLMPRFDWRFAVAAVVALLHDSLFTFGMFALSGREITLPIIAAILTIIGYSVNDTIVNFDRIRENSKNLKKMKFEDIVNLSINQMLGRTILTSFTVILCTLSLFLFGGSGIEDFAFALLIGFSVGIYSTIFVASALVVDWKIR